MEGFKRLYKFAHKEYRDKRPKQILGYMVKRQPAFIKGFSPSFQIQRQVVLEITYLVFANYGDSVRMYYFSSELLQLGAQNVDPKNFEKLEKKLKKAMKKIFVLPRKTKEELIEEKRTAYHKIISHLKHLRMNFKELQETFAREHESIRTRTGLKGNPPIITLTDKRIEQGARFGVKEDEKFLYISLYCLNSKFLNILIYREIFLTLLPRWVPEALRLDFAYLGAWCVLSPPERQLLFKMWDPSVEIELLNPLKQRDLKATVGFLRYLDKYLDIDSLTEKEAHYLFSIITHTHSRGPELLAEWIFTFLNSKDALVQDVFTAKRFLFKFMREGLLEEQDEFPGIFSQLSSSLVSLRFFKFYESFNKLDAVPKGLKLLIQAALRRVKPIKIERTAQRTTDSWVEITTTISNLTDLILIPSKIKDSDYQGHDFKGSLEFEKIYPDSTVNLILGINLPENESINLTPIQISLIDDFKNKYRIKSKSLKI